MEETAAALRAGMEATSATIALLRQELDAARQELAAARQREDRLAADHRRALDALASRPLAAVLGWARTRFRRE